MVETTPPQRSHRLEGCREGHWRFGGLKIESRFLLWLVITFWTAPCFPPLEAVAGASQAVPRPNILWLSCEDLSPRLGCYGDQTAPTPNIDRLATEGVRFTRAFTATGVCAPCRHTIITGLYPMQSGAQHMRTVSRSSAKPKGLPPEVRKRARERRLYEATPPAGVRCFPEYLRMAGYYCTNNSKQDYQFKAPVTAWDDSSGKAHYRNRAPGQPFFAVFNATVTHESGIHGNGRSPRRVDPASVAVPSFLPDTATVRLDIARHYDNLIALDAWVGEKLAELEAEGLSDSTIVFFFSDHGDGLPRCKRWVYDSGTWVPLIVRYPDGRLSGSVDEGLMSFVDLAPTVLSIAGVKTPDYMRGRVFAGDDTQPPHDYVFMHRDRIDDTSFDTVRSVRGPRFRYVRNYKPQLPYLHPVAYRDRAATMGEVYKARDEGLLTDAQWQWAAPCKPIEEFYDTQADPDNVVNLASDPAHAEELGELRSALEEWTRDIDDPLAQNEMEALRTRVWPPDGKQPSTAPPEAEVTPLEQGSRVTLRCATDGASLGYRTSDSGPWNVYQGAFETEEPEVEVVSHRIGWKPAYETVSLQP